MKFILRGLNDECGKVEADPLTKVLCRQSCLDDIRASRDLIPSERNLLRRSHANKYLAISEQSSAAQRLDTNSFLIAAYIAVLPATYNAGTIGTCVMRVVESLESL